MYNDVDSAGPGGVGEVVGARTTIFDTKKKGDPMTAAMTLILACLASDSEVAKAIEVLRGVDKEAKGNRAATEAWSVVANAPAEEMTTVLSAYEGANPIAANYLTAAWGALTAKHNKKIPLKDIEAFLQAGKGSPIARRLAFELIVEKNPKLKSALLDELIDDSSVEIRRDAVAAVLTTADSAFTKKVNDSALKEYTRALLYARDQDQVEAAAGKLRTLGKPVDVARHFGFLQDWKLIGPFDNTAGAGWDRAFPPESTNEPFQEVEGKVGVVKWISHVTDDDLGNVDLNVVYPKKFKGSIVYAQTDFVSPKKQSVEIRLGSIVAWKAWLNGRLIFERNESHSGEAFDQYAVPVELKEGENKLLFKFCQNEQTEVWAQAWNFRVRICDSVGTAILSSNRPPAKPTMGPPKVDPAKEKSKTPPPAAPKKPSEPKSGATK